MSITKQDLLSLKEENLKFKENFDEFLQKHEPNKKFISKRDVKEFMEEQKTLMDTINHRVDEIIAAKDQDENPQQARKFKKVRAKKLVKSNIFFVKLHFWQF